MKKAKHITAAILLVLIAIVVFQNTETVQTKILFATLSMPRAVLLFVTLTIGIIIGFILGSRRKKLHKTEV